MPAARPSQAVIRNAIKAAQLCGMDIGAIEVTPDGGVRIVAASTGTPLTSPEQGEDAWDAATGLRS